MLLPGSRENERRLSVIFKIASRKKVGILLLLIITTIVVVLSFFAVNRAPPSYILWNLAAMISCNPQTGRHLLHLQIISKLLTGSTFDQVGIISEVASIIREFTKPLANHGLYLVEAERVSRHPVLLVAAADSSEGLQPPVRRCVSHEIAMSPLIEAQRADMLSSSLEGVSKLQHENIRDDLIKDVIGQTSSFMPRDINGLVADASANFVHRILNDKDNNGSRESGYIV
ncbi:peroxisome biogenesis protein 6-like isoform X3 [Asparagus officinalis]|uniref:peroxisome biogenesis protein 6-like isoform X3 n=1 Tax=Asparagus officinalis TaxID=4686 RepID=UPI00098E2809|nr:peroxisome biogenesis protein 6-like isoform X3 [Asparagus officinalis]